MHYAQALAATQTDGCALPSPKSINGVSLENTETHKYLDIPSIYAPNCSNGSLAVNIIYDHYKNNAKQSVMQ
jgi:hypothetical protein